MRTLQQIADQLALAIRPIAPGSTLLDVDVALINTLAEAMHGRENPDRFAHALSHVLIHEGGYVNHPRDPGGATNKGVTQRVYDDWRRKQGKSPRSVRDIEASEIGAIYRREYWDKVRGDDLPAGVDYAVFDFAVNSGVSRATKYLQAVVGVAQDGVIGPATLAAVAASPRHVVEAIMDKRVAFLKGLETFPTFGRGWMARCDGVRRLAGEMVG